MEEILNSFLVSIVTQMASVSLLHSFRLQIPTGVRRRVGVNIIMKTDKQTYIDFHFSVPHVFELITEVNVHHSEE